MTPRAEKRLITGPAGQIELALDWPLQPMAAGLACVGHPHPLYGGTMDNKVAATIARTFSALGWLAVVHSLGAEHHKLVAPARTEPARQVAHS